MSERLRALAHLDLFFWTISFVLLVAKFASRLGAVEIQVSWAAIAIPVIGGIVTTGAGFYFANKEGFISFGGRK